MPTFVNGNKYLGMSVGERIRKGRVLKGFTLRALGEKVGLSHTQISNIEKGEKGVNGPTLLAISNALGIPLDYFVHDNTYTIDSDSVSFRKVKSLSGKENDKIWECVERQVENYLELEDIMDERTAFPIDLFNAPTIQSPDDIERITEHIRSTYRLGQAPIPNISYFLENMGIKVIGIPGKKGFDGVSFYADASTPIIAYNNSIMSSERRRMTLLHELGHILIGHSADGVEGKEVEHICTTFASHLLLPTRVIKEFFGGRRRQIALAELIEIQTTYGISIDAIMYRLKEMLFISDSYYKSYCIRKNQSPEYKTIVEQSRYIEPKSNRFERLVIKAIDSAVITQSKALIYLKEAGMSEEEAANLLNDRI